MKKCLVCESEVKEIMSFGDMPIANGFLYPKDFEKEKHYPLTVGFCECCGMVQLTSFVDREEMFNENYAFFSSTSKGMINHFSEFAKSVMDNCLGENPFVVEIGSNDGIMLKNFAEKGIKHLGVEPSENVAEVAKNNGINTVSVFFDKENAQKIVKEYGKADVILGANVMCHIPYIHSVFDGADELLKDDGMLIFEDPYLGDIVRRASYDQIYDEHAFYFSAHSVSYLSNMHGLELVDVVPQEVHGGEMRYYIARKGTRPVSSRVKELMDKEQLQGLYKIETYHELWDRIENNKRELVSLLKKLKGENKRVAAYGATSKSTTVLNYCGIGPDLIEYISDNTPTKIGKCSPGSHIPIKDYKEFVEDYPEYAVLFAWNHAKEIMAKEDGFKQSGGKFIMYVDGVRIE